MPCEPITITAPDSIPSPSSSPLTVNKTAVTDLSISFGSLFDFVDVFANDFTIMANGIDPLQLYNNGSRAYEVSVLAPPTALTATSSSSVNTIMRPESNEISLLCGVSGEDMNETTPTWFDNSGTEYSRAISPATVCDNYQAVYETTADDDGYVVWLETQNAATSYKQYTRWGLSSLSYTPSSGQSATIRVRIRYQDFGTPSHTTTFKVHLYQGHPVNDSGASVIHTTTWTEADLSTSFTDKDITVTSGEADNITDWTDLYLVCELSTNHAVPDYREIHISQAYLTASSAGSTGLAAGVYSYVYTYVRSATGAESGPSPALDYTHTTSGDVRLNDITFSDDPTVDFINIYRTVQGGGEYHLVTTVPNDEAEAIPSPTDGIQDAVQDVDLTDSNAVILDIERKRSYEAGLPPKGRYLASYKNRVFTGGAILDAPYSAGTATFTYGSATVTGTGTYWTDKMKGRVIRVTGTPAVDPKGVFKPGGAIQPGVRDRFGSPDKPVRPREKTQTYRIIEVNSLTSITISRVFDEDSAVTDYEIVDDRNPYQISWSYAGQPEDWPVENGIEIPGETGDGITGLVTHLGSLIIFTHDSIHRLSGDDESNFRVDLVFKGTGCVSGHSITTVNNLVYFQAQDGWYAFDGAAPFPISSPPTQEGFVTGIDRTAKRIHQARAKMVVALHDDANDCILTYNSLDGDFEHRGAIVYDVKSGAWSEDDAPNVVSTGTVFGPLGNELQLVGDVLGNIWQLNQGTSDGAFSGTIVGTVTSADNNTVTCSAASFLTTGDGLAGVPAALVDENGTITRFTILSNTATALESLHILPVTPDTNYRVIVGYIDFNVQTGWVNYGAPHKAKVLEYVEWVYQQATQGELYCQVGVDNGTLTYRDERVDLSNGKSVGRIFTRQKGHHIKVGMRSFVPGHEVVIVSSQHYILAVGDQE